MFVKINTMNKKHTDTHIYCIYPISCVTSCRALWNVIAWIDGIERGSEKQGSISSHQIDVWMCVVFFSTHNIVTTAENLSFKWWKPQKLIFSKFSIITTILRNHFEWISRMHKQILVNRV